VTESVTANVKGLNQHLQLHLRGSDVRRGASEKKRRQMLC
jgi:hypothetical protein